MKTYSLVVLLLVQLAFFTCVLPAGADENIQPAPDFSLVDINGEVVTSGSLRGRNSLLLFGSTQCPHCETALVLLENISQVFGDELKVAFVAMHQSRDELAEFFIDGVPSYNILLDETGIAAASYNIKRVPTSVFIDEDGLVQYRGRLSEDVLWRLLSGERFSYPDLPRGEAQASGRFLRRAGSRARDTKRFIVELDESPSRSKKLSKAAVKSRQGKFNKATKDMGGRIVHNYGRWGNKIVVEIPPGKVNKLKELPGFRSSKEDRRVHALIEDSAYQIMADYGWDNAITGQGVKVCVVDTGIDYSHPDLRNKVIAQHNFITGSEDAMDDQGHGTHVAGIIASEGSRYRGISHDVALMSAKVLDSTGAGFASDVALGINWCVEQGADIISLSLGEGLYSGACDFDEMAQAVNHAVDPCGVVVVCASGNDGDLNAVVAPACASGAIAVGAVDKLDNIASYSNGGSQIDLVAPGGDMLGGTDYPEIVSTFSTEVANNPFYCFYSIDDTCYDNYFVVDGTRYIRAIGTSMATPHVAAAAALLLEENPYLTPGQIRDALGENADDLGTAGWDNVFGWGRINLEKAIDNLPSQRADLTVKIVEPNASETFLIDGQFSLTAEIDCYGGDGCGEVDAYAQFCDGDDCNDFVDINMLTAVSTLGNNPNEVGHLSGWTIETQAPIIFDVETTYDISEQSYAKSVNPSNSFVGSTLVLHYETGDLEPSDGLGAIGEDAMKVYEFNIPPGDLNSIQVRMEHYLVLQWDEPPSGWNAYTSNASGDSLTLIGDCSPDTGGGGEPPPADCWFVSEDPCVLADLNPGGTSYIKVVSHDVGANDWLTFNDVEVMIEYEIDPNNDDVYQYYVKFDLGDVNAFEEVTAARLNLSVAQCAEDCVAEVYLVDNGLLQSDSAQILHDANDAPYSGLVNPIKSFGCQGCGTVSINAKVAVVEALTAGQGSIAFQIRELGDDQLFAVDANTSGNGPVLTISQKVPQGSGQQPPGESPVDANSGPRPLTYESLVVKDVSEDTYTKYDDPCLAQIGSPIAAEYSTGDLEPNDGLGAIGENAEKLYQFEIPDGEVRELRVRMEHYLVLQWDEPNSGWYVYTSNANGDYLNLVGECSPDTGGGGEPPSADCWFVSDDPCVLSDLNPGGTNFIKLLSHDVGPADWLSFNDIEAIVEYEVDPNNDNINRYYLKFDISSFTGNAKVDSATLNLYVAEPNSDTVAEIRLVDSTYDPCTGAYTIYHAEDAPYSSLTNPIKTFACEIAGLKQINVRAAMEDAIESGVDDIAFLITEQGENSLFAIDANGNPNPPGLNVYLELGISSGQAAWNVLANKRGAYSLRVLATNNIDANAISDTIVINVSDPNVPVINGVDCMINSQWKNCSEAQYGDDLQKIRIDANDPQEIPTVWLKLRNSPDDHNFIDDEVPYTGGSFIYDTYLTIADSGEWQIQVLCSDSDDNDDTDVIIWNVPWGSLSSYLTSPATDIAVPKSGSFNVTASAQCLDAECPDVNLSVTLNDLTEIKFDDGSAEDYGDIGSTSGYLAVRITPAYYPAKLKTARFYIWDETAYSFELRVWDDNGSAGAPGVNLTTPFTVDPVVASSPQQVAWFDVDLSDSNIIINSGSFYIGFRQIEEGKVNQVGFDTNSALHTRSWGYLPSFGWFNLNDYCLLGFSEYCGNLMIRATMGEVVGYDGLLPNVVSSAPFYTLDNHPKDCGQLNAGETCDATFEVYAIGQVDEYARIYSMASNNFSFDKAGSVKVTITEPQTDCDAANLDAVGFIDFHDLVILAGQWGQTSSPLSADIHIDQQIDMLDVGAMVNYWLSNCGEP